MNLLLNLIWLIFGGFIVVLAYLFGGILLCITIIGIPFGIQCFKLAGLALMPFGQEIREKEPPGGAIAVIMNIIWIILPGLELAIFHLVMALLFAITIIEAMTPTFLRFESNSNTKLPLAILSAILATSAGSAPSI